MLIVALQFIKDSEANKEAMRTAQAQMRDRLGHDQRLCDMLIPECPLGCRRITPGEGYLESFLLPNCDLTMSPIARVSEHAIHTVDDQVFEADVCKFTIYFQFDFIRAKKISSGMRNRLRRVIPTTFSHHWP